MFDYTLFKELYEVLDVPAIAFFTFGIFMILVMARWHADNGPFDFRAALLDPNTGHISFLRLGQFVCLSTSTALLCYESTKGRLTEWLFIGYMAAWAGSYVYGKYLDSKGQTNQTATPVPTPSPVTPATPSAPVSVPVTPSPIPPKPVMMAPPSPKAE